MIGVETKDSKNLALSVNTNIFQTPFVLERGKPLSFHYGVCVWEGERSSEEIQRGYAQWCAANGFATAAAAAPVSPETSPARSNFANQPEQSRQQQNASSSQNGATLFGVPMDPEKIVNTAINALPVSGFSSPVNALAQAKEQAQAAQKLLKRFSGTWEKSFDTGKPKTKFFKIFSNGTYVDDYVVKKGAKPLKKSGKLKIENGIIYADGAKFATIIDENTLEMGYGNHRLSRRR
jgi:hypothetical protein